MGDKQIWLALIGTIGPLVGAIALLITHRWTRNKNQAEANKANAEANKANADADLVTADAELVTANTLTVVIEGLRSELARVTERVDDLEDALAEERKLRIIAQDLAHAARQESIQAQHRFDVLLGYHHQVATIAAEAQLALPAPPALLEPHLRH